MNCNSTNVGTAYNCTANCSDNICNNGEEEEIYLYDFSMRARFILSKPSFIIAIILGIVGVMANIFSLIAIIKVFRSLTSYLRIAISLLVSDLLVAVTLLAHVVVTVLLPQMQPGYGPWQPRITSRCAFMIIKALNTVSLNVTLLNLMAMAVNHYIAIIRPFQLHRLLNKRRTNLMILMIWIIAAISGFSNFLSPVGELDEYWRWKNKFNYCEFIWLTKYQEEYITFFIAVICFLLMVSIYLRIYFEVRYKSSKHVMNECNTSNKKAIYTTMIILGSFIICWLPLFTFNIILIIVARHEDGLSKIEAIMSHLHHIEEYLYDLVLLNTVLDPLVYAVRVKEIRRSYIQLCGGQKASYEFELPHLSPLTSYKHPSISSNSSVLTTVQDTSYSSTKWIAKAKSVKNDRTNTASVSAKLMENNSM